MSAAREDTFVQEACLGRVKMMRGKKICYLIKWAGWNNVQDITCEPATNVKVKTAEEPLLQQGSETFQKELEDLLIKYLAGNGQQPAAASPSKDAANGSGAPPPREPNDAGKESVEEPAQEAVEESQPAKKPQSKPKVSKKRQQEEAPEPVSASKKAKGASSSQKPAEKQSTVTVSPVVPVKATTSMEAVQVAGSTYSVSQRQFVVVDNDHVHCDGNFAAVFMHLDQAEMNPGFGWTIKHNLRAPGSHPDEVFLGGSVDRMSSFVGFGWFLHAKSGVSLGGLRQADHVKYPFLRFEKGDTVGIVVDTQKGIGYCVREGTTVFRVTFATSQEHQMLFALHLCKGDQVTLCSPTNPLPSYANDSVPEVHTQENTKTTSAGNVSRD